MAAANDLSAWGGVILAAALVSVVWLVPILLRVRRARRVWREIGDRVALRCHRCGYDIRATRGVCPECGASVENPLPEFSPRTKPGVARSIRPPLESPDQTPSGEGVNPRESVPNE